MNKKGVLIGLALVGLTILPMHFPFDKTVAFVVGFGMSRLISSIKLLG